jgi:hypothetical protein
MIDKNAKKGGETLAKKEESCVFVDGRKFKSALRSLNVQNAENTIKFVFHPLGRSNGSCYYGNCRWEK